MDLGLRDATVVVAGGTSGMGRAAAECFAADGARVAVFARSKPDLDDTAAALTQLGSPDAVGLAVDLFDHESVDVAMAELGDRWGHLNALVNAAGPLENLSMSLAPDILVNTVSPGTFASESFRSSLAQVPGVDENDLHDIMRYIGENFDNHVHLDRAAAPSEIGPVIAFLASALNSYTTGANVNVDGGSDFT
jgi:NAD(P)-dependent dehydrogenase (short-subunit alcohol dehydrogenase family)